MNNDPNNDSQHASEAISEALGKAGSRSTQGPVTENSGKTHQPTEEANTLELFEFLKSYDFSRPRKPLLEMIQAHNPDLSAEQTEAIKSAIENVEGPFGVFIRSDVDGEKVRQFYQEAGRVVSGKVIEMPALKAEDFHADWAGLPSNENSQGPKTPDEAVSEALGKAGGARAKAAPAKLSWREVMKDTLQEAASQGAQAITPLSQDLSVLRELRRNAQEEQQGPDADGSKPGPKP